MAIGLFLSRFLRFPQLLYLLLRLLIGFAEFQLPRVEYFFGLFAVLSAQIIGADFSMP